MLSEHALCRHGTAELLRSRGFRVAEASAPGQVRAGYTSVVIDLDHTSFDTHQLIEHIGKLDAHAVLVGTPQRLGAIARVAPCVETPGGGLADVVAAANGRAARPSPELVRQRRVWSKITPRQREVLRQLAAGRDNRSIAHELGVGERTVKGHVTVLLIAFDAESRTELALIASRAGLRTRRGSL